MQNMYNHVDVQFYKIAGQGMAHQENEQPKLLQKH